jgi:uncharacterized protein DUF4274
LVQVIAHHEISPIGEEDIRLENVAEFIMDQPQAFWLLYILNMNWDVNDEIVEAMIARPDADLAIIAHLFWGSEPSYYCKYPERLPGSNIERILRNLRKGWYKNSEFWLPRGHFARGATAFIRFASSPENTPFDVPLKLFGPFDGRKAVLDFPLDMVSLDRMERWFPDFALDVTAAQSESYWDRFDSYVSPSFLPQITEDHAERFSHLNMFDYCESLYWTNDRLVMELEKERKRRARQQSLEKEQLPQSPIAIVNRLSKPQQMVLGLSLVGVWILLVFWITGFLN